MKGLSILFLVFIFHGVFAQDTTMTFNNYDLNEKKHGYWKVYVDEYWNYKEDTSLAKFYYFAYYHHGKLIKGFENIFRSPNSKLGPINNSSRDQKKGAVPINGKYVIKTGVNRSSTLEIEFKEGFYIYGIRFYDESKKRWEKYDYSMKYQGKEASFYYTGKLTKNAFRKGYIYYPDDSTKPIDLTVKVK